MVEGWGRNHGFMLSLMTPPYRFHPCRGRELAISTPARSSPAVAQQIAQQYHHPIGGQYRVTVVGILAVEPLMNLGNVLGGFSPPLPTQLSELTSTPPCFHSSLACPAGTVDGGAIPEGLYRATHSPRRDEGSGLAGSGMAGRMTGSGMAGSGLAVAAQLTRGSSLTSCWCERVTGFFICAFCGKRGGPVGGAVG